jgi:hypothetical protein
VANYEQQPKHMFYARFSLYVRSILSMPACTFRNRTGRIMEKCCAKREVIYISSNVNLRMACNHACVVARLRRMVWPDSLHSSHTSYYFLVGLNVMWSPSMCSNPYVIFLCFGSRNIHIACIATLLTQQGPKACIHIKKKESCLSPYTVTACPPKV